MKSLPTIWAAKRRAKKLLKKFPKYEGELKIPDSDEIFSWIEGICQPPHRRPGSLEGHKAEQWVAGKFRELDLEGVAMDPIPITLWEAKNWSLEVDGHEIPSFFIVNSGFTGVAGLTAPLVFVGKGTKKDFKKVDAEGKIVVADVPFPYIPTGLLVRLLKLFWAAYIVSDPDHSLKWKTGQYLNFVRRNFVGGATEESAPSHDVYWRAHKQGAKAICLILKDQPSNSNSHYGPYDGIMKPMPGLWIGKYDGLELREKAKAGATATLVLEGSSKPGTMHNIWGVLPGMSDQVVLVSSHHDAPFKGAVEDGTGIAQVLAQAKIWSGVPKEKRERTLVFVACAGHFYGIGGSQAFARDHPDLMLKARACITLEHLGGKEVEEEDQHYVETDDLALTVMFTSSDPLMIATVINALKKKPPKRTLPIPATMFAPVPVSDAAGYALESDVPVISWIGCPYYLLDEHDTLEMVAKKELVPICETITELVKPFMCDGFKIISKS